MNTDPNHSSPQSRTDGPRRPLRRGLFHRREAAISLELTLYVDGRLDAADSERVASLITEDPQIRNEYEELRRLRDLLAARPPIPADPWLAERVMNRIRAEEAEETTLLPLPRRLRPLPAAALGVVAVAMLVFAWVQRHDIYRYMSDTGTQVQHAYQETIVKGWIMPLFERTNQDQVLEFAMFGTLPLDMNDGTMLRVDENEDRGYRVELASSATQARPAATVDELYREIQPTEAQRKIFDTLFHYAQRQLESAVLVNEGREIAVNPSIGRFHTVILSGIASNLEAEQLVRFERFLDSRNAPYTLVSHRESGALAPPPPPQQAMERIRTVRAGEEFVVLDPDSYSVVRLSLDMDSLRRLMHRMEREIPRFEFRVQELARSYATRGERETSRPPRPPRGVQVSPVTVQNGAQAISISIGGEAEVLADIDEEFQTLRQQIVVLRRESEALRDREFVRIEEFVRRGQTRPRESPHASGRRARISSGPSGLSITVDSDSARIIHMKIDTTLRLPDGSTRELHFEMRDLLEKLPREGQFHWREAIPPSEMRRIDSLLRDTNIERLLAPEDIERLRLELYEEQLERGQVRPERPSRKERNEIRIIPAPAPEPALPPTPPPATKDSMREI